MESLSQEIEREEASCSLLKKYNLQKLSHEVLQRVENSVSSMGQRENHKRGEGIQNKSGDGKAHHVV